MEPYQAEEQEATLTIVVGKALALVLDNLLDRWANFPNEFVLQLEDDAEWHALNIVAGALETQLGEPFRSDYAEQLTAARRKVIARWGEVEQ